MIKKIKTIIQGAFGLTKLNEELVTLRDKIEQLNLHKPENLKIITTDLLKHIPIEGAPDLQLYDKWYSVHGGLKSSKNYSNQAKLDARIYFHHREKSEIAQSVASSLFEGDYFEFGADSLGTFNNMTAACDIEGLTEIGRDIEFYAFDIFGSDISKTTEAQESKDQLKDFFAPFLHEEKNLEAHLKILHNFGLYIDKCHLIQGFFEDTLTDEFKKTYRERNRQVGFAFIDCNIGSSYKLVFDFLEDIISKNAFIYMDEFFQNERVPALFEKFFCNIKKKYPTTEKLYVRNAAGFGALFRFRDIS